jgi:hypothetical protein
MATRREIAYRAKMRELLAELDHLKSDTVKNVFKHLESTRKNLSLQLLDVTDESWQAYHLTNLKRATNRAIKTFSQQYVAELHGQEELIWEVSKELVDTPLKAFEVGVSIPELNLTTLKIAQAGTADLVTGPGGFIDALIGKINGILNRSVLGELSPFEAIKAIGKNLKDPGPFRSIMTRAETIARTELGRIQNMAANKRLEKVQKRVPEMQRQWLHSGALHGRPSHIAANGQVRPVGVKFDIGGEQLMYPLDPDAPAKETINCGCTTSPYMSGWPSVQVLKRAA